MFAILSWFELTTLENTITYHFKVDRLQIILVAKKYKSTCRNALCLFYISIVFTGADLGGGCRGCAHPLPEMTCGFLIQLVFCKKKKKTMWFIGVEVEQETSAPPPKKNP